MDWLRHIDSSLFFWVNRDWQNPAFDWLMPLLAGNKLFLPAVAIAAAFILWKGKLRGLVCLLMLAALVGFTDGVVCRTLKELVGRERPFAVLDGVRLLVGPVGPAACPLRTRRTGLPRQWSCLSITGAASGLCFREPFSCRFRGCMTGCIFQAM